MNKLENKRYTFWELLQKVGIKIPIIQRDYAQGRRSKQVANIRDNFVKKLFDILTTDESIDLDFVYGTVQNGFLIPLDGQQRLTTLFLFHYYLALQDNKLNDENKKILQKFTYETRLSSREFTALLLDKGVDSNNNKISPTIKNQTWFFSEWENDPTIRGMFVMLDSIEKYYKQKNIQGLFEKLREKEKITFSFLNLEDFKLTDELYIKMNARGKPLTEFENFKSRFENFIDVPKNKAKLDNEWYDIFWKIGKNSENPAKEVDKLFLNFFKNMTAFYSDEFNEVDIFKFDYKDKIDEITKTLECLLDYEDSLIYELRDNENFKINIFKYFLKDSDKITYEERLRFYALIKFFVKVGAVTEDNKKLFKQWMRVSLNIIQNSIYNTIKDFSRDKKLLDDLIKQLDNSFYNYLSNSSISKIHQFNEEKLKAKLIVNYNLIEEEFIQAENNWYLDGQIGFLIEFATKENNFNLDDFKLYRNKFIKLWEFSKENKEKQRLIYQALLTKGNYLPKIGSNHTFCSFETSIRAKTDNWQKVFNNEKKRGYLKSLLDDGKFIISDIETSLNKIIFSYSFKCDNPLSFFIINSSYIQYCEKLQIRWYDNNEIYLLKTTQMNGTHAELYTYDLYMQKIKDQQLALAPFKKSEYFYTNSLERPCVMFKGWKVGGFKYQLDISYEDKKYKIYFYEENDKQINQVLVDVLKNNNFVLNSEKFYILETNYECLENDELIKFLEKLIISLQNDPI